jgi:hypothetical protein
LLLKSNIESNEDVLSGAKYTAALSNHNAINLCLFCDSTPIVKSKNLQMWVIASSIIDLPHKIRESVNNLVLHSILIGNQFDFNRWFELYSSCFGNLFNSEVCGRPVKLFCAIFDSPARAKVINMVGHTGFYSCHVCEIRGKYNTKVVFPYIKETSIKLRSNEGYIKALSNVQLNKRPEHCLGLS